MIALKIANWIIAQKNDLVDLVQDAKSVAGFYPP